MRHRAQAQTHAQAQAQAQAQLGARITRGRGWGRACVWLVLRTEHFRGL